MWGEVVEDFEPQMLESGSDKVDLDSDKVDSDSDTVDYDLDKVDLGLDMVDHGRMMVALYYLVLVPKMVAPTFRSH